MTRTSSYFRPLVLLLTMHLAHVPVPVWDSGDAIGWTDSDACISGPGRWDFDLFLLGIDPPDDLDEGPVDSDPEGPGAHMFASGRPSSRPAMAWKGDLDAFAPVTLPDSRRVELSFAAHRDGPGIACYSASFAGPQQWRTLLTVLTI